MVQGKDIVGFPTTVMDVDVQEIIDSRTRNEDIDPILDLDFKISHYFKKKFSFYNNFFKSRNHVETPYRFVGAPQNNYSSIASVVEAYLVDENCDIVPSLDNVKKAVLVSFLVPTERHTSNDGIVSSITYKNVFAGNNVIEQAINQNIINEKDFVVNTPYIFFNFDPMDHYESQLKGVDDLYKQIQRDLIAIKLNGESRIVKDSKGKTMPNRTLPDIMYDGGVDITIPLITEKAIYAKKEADNNGTV